MNDSKLPALNSELVLALLRITLGALFLSTFFENLHKDLYTAKGYASLIRYYIQYGHAPEVWKHVMAITAAHAPLTGPAQGVLECSLGIFLIIGLLSRAAALVAFGFLTGLWVSEWGLGWIWELLVPMAVAAALSIGASGRRAALDVTFAQRWPKYPI